MFKGNANGRRIAATLLAIALSACGSIQGASPAGAGLPAGGPSGDNHLVEFDTNDSASQTTGDAGLLGGEYPPAPASPSGDDSAVGARTAPALAP